MTTIRKLKAIILEEDIDAVVGSLGEAGIAEFIDLREKVEDWKGVLVPHKVSTEVLTKSLDLLSKIDDRFEHVGLKPEEHPFEEISTFEEPIKKGLDRIEQKLGELPVEAYTNCLTLSSRIDLLIEALGEKQKDVPVERVVLKKPVEETIAEIEGELFEIENALETTHLTDRHVLIDKLETLPLEEKGELGRKLAMLRTYTLENERFFIERLSSLKKQVEASKETIETENKLWEIREDLLTFHKTIEQEKQIVGEQEKFLRTEKTIYFEAWVPESNIKEATEIIQEVTEGNSVVTNEPPSSEDKSPCSFQSVPSYISSFGGLITAVGFPTATEFNPLPLVAITFPLLFGIMFADVGQGAIFIVLGLFLTWFKKRVNLNAVVDILRYVLISSELFIFLGISAMFFGFLFGEFFGSSGVIPPISLGRLGPFYFGGFEPLHEPMKMARFALLVGVVHLSLGMILRITNEVKQQCYKRVAVSLCWLWLLIGGFFMWVSWGGISSIPLWLTDGSTMLLGLVIAPLLLVLVFGMLAVGGMEGVGFGVEVFSETLSHTLSYLRLMGLGLVHSAMSSMFLMLGGVEHGYFPLSSLPIVAIGTILVMSIEGLIVFIHDLRLHWIEWFSKFYTGTGFPFRPFKLK